MSIKNKIEQIIYEEVQLHNGKGQFRDPIIGYVDAMDEGFGKIESYTGVRHYKPTELLKDAKTVVVFFLPYSAEIVRKMQREKKIVLEYSEAYLDANELLKKIATRLQEELIKEGIDAASQPPTDDYDYDKLAAHWSHKSIAVMAGIGTIGLNHMLITKQGVSGRLNSIVINKKIEATPRREKSLCLYYKNGSCKACVKRCPSGGLTEKGLNKKICSSYLDGKCLDLDEQGCPMCMSGPCAMRGF